MNGKIFIFISIFHLLLKNFVNSQCLISKDGSISECVECFVINYYNFSIPYQGGGESFLNTQCLSRITSSSISVEIFVSPNACEAPPCDGSALKPYDNLLYALLEGWRRVNPYSSSKLSFKLLGNGLDGALESSDFFINKMDYPSDLQYLFRTISSEILIETGYCSSTFNVKGCVKNSGLKARIYIRTESLYIFVGRIFEVR